MEGEKFIHGWGGYDYTPEVYFIDFYDDISQTKIEDFIINNDMEDDDSSLDEARKYIAENKMKNFFDIKLKQIINENELKSTFNKRFKVNELSASKFYYDIFVIGCTANTLIVNIKKASHIKNGDNLTYIGFVPVVKFDNLFSIIFEENQDKIDQFEKDGKNFDDFIHQETEKKYKQVLEQFQYEKGIIFNSINKYFKPKGKDLSKVFGLVTLKFGFMKDKQIKKPKS